MPKKEKPEKKTKEKKRPKDSSIAEIRGILLGRYEITDGGNLSPIPYEKRRHFRIVQGHTTGDFTARILGIMHSRKIFELDTVLPERRIVENMQHIGRIVKLEKSPDKTACLCPCRFASPVMLTAFTEDGTLTVDAYSAKGILSIFGMKICIKRFTSKLPIKSEKPEEKESEEKQDKKTEEE